MPPCAEDRERATELVQEHGTDSLAYFALRRDKSYFFAPSGTSFLAYRVIGSTALVAGDPIGEERERGELMREFVRVAHTKGWRVAIAGASNEALEDYAAIGFKSMYLGDEAVIKPSEFSLEGGAIRKVRQSVTRLEKGGYEVRMLSTADADDALRAELRAVSEEWRGTWPERGFTMAMDALFRYPDTVLAVAVGPEGTVGGFLQLVPSPASEGYSLSSMRRRKDTPNGLMEYLITEAVGWAREHNVTEVSLNFAVFADFLRADEDAGALTARRALGAPEGRSPVPGRAPAQLQPQVLPALAAPLLLLRAVERPPARRARLPAGRVAADAARPLGQDTRTWQRIEVAARARGGARCGRSRPSRSPARRTPTGAASATTRRATTSRPTRRSPPRTSSHARAPAGAARRDGRLVADLRRAGCSSSRPRTGAPRR